jgi:hypothetical protein
MFFSFFGSVIFQGAQEGFAVFSQKKNEPKRKVAAGCCGYLSAVAGSETIRVQCV